MNDILKRYSWWKKEHLERMSVQDQSNKQWSSNTGLCVDPERESLRTFVGRTGRILPVLWCEDVDDVNKNYIL